MRMFSSHSSYFAAALKGNFLDGISKKIDLPDEEPETLSCILEFLYKGDYYPRLLHNKRRNTWDSRGFAGG